jgi:TonB-linked SusC/RagA family outer membrane protein
MQLYNTEVVGGKDETTAATNASKNLLSNLGYTEAYYPFSGAAFNNVVGTDGKFNPAAKFLYEDDVDWIGATERVGQVQDYSISASGKGKYTTYFGSASYTDNKGYMVGTGFERYAARANVAFEKNWLKFGVNASASVSDQSGNLSTSSNDRQNAYHVVLKIVPTYPIHLHWADGSYVLDGSGNKIYDFGEGYNQPDDFTKGLKVYYKPDGVSYDVIPGRPDFSFNVAAYTANRFSHYKRNIINVKPYIEIKLPFDLKFTANASIYNSNYTAHSATPYFEDYKGHSSSATLTFSNTQTMTANQLLSWTRTFGDHHVDALIGHESYSWGYDYETSSKTNQIIIGTNYQFNNYSETSSLPSGYRNTYATESYLGRVNYDYLSKYYLSASFRRDGSSDFYTDARWGNFWSVGASWIITNEEFMKGIPNLDQLKLRASIGTVGNDNLGDHWKYMATYVLKQNDTEPGYAQDLEAPGNLLLKWEVSTNVDVALEFQAFKRRLTGTFEYFHRSTSDLLLDVNLAPSSGKTSYPSNDGGLLNSGFEFQLGYDIIKTKKVKWNVGANASLLKNKVTYLPIPAYTFNGSYNKIEEGHSVYEWWLYQWKGVNPANGLNYFALGDEFFKKDAEGNLTNEYIDGIDTDADVVTIDGNYYTTAIARSKQDYSGSPLPKVYGGITTDLTVGNFSLALNLYYQLGGVGYDRGYSNILQQGIIGDNKPYINRHVDAAKSWQKPGDVTDFAILTSASTKAIGSSTYSENTTATRSTRWLTTTNMLEINNVTMSYTLPKKLCNKIQLSGIKLYASADHLYLFNARRGYYTNYSLSNYTSNASYSKPARTITVGVNFTL